MSMCRRERLLTAGLQIRRSPDLHSTISSMEERHIQVILAVRYDRWCVENRACSKFSAPRAAGARSAIREAAMTRQASRLAQRAEKSPSLLIEKNPELMRFGIRHSVATLGGSVPTVTNHKSTIFHAF